MNAKIALITGATDGIGLALANLLASNGYKLIIHGRNATKLEAISSKIELYNPDSVIEKVILDLSDISGSKIVWKSLASKFACIDIVINNAGTYLKTLETTSEGYEKTFVVNYLSRFILVYYLLPSLGKSNSALIIDVSGAYHRKGKLDYNQIKSPSAITYSGQSANNAAKLANVSFTIYLANLLKNTKIKTISLHTGIVKTSLVYKAGILNMFTKLVYNLSSIFMKSPELAAKEILALIKNTELQSGSYFEGTEKSEPSITSLDKAASDLLILESENISGLTFPKNF